MASNDDTGGSMWHGNPRDFSSESVIQAGSPVWETTHAMRLIDAVRKGENRRLRRTLEIMEGLDANPEVVAEMLTIVGVS